MRDREQEPGDDAPQHRRRVMRCQRTARERVRLLLLRAVGLASRLLCSLASHSPPLSAPASVLVIRPDHLGDLLLLTPALRRLRERFPEARIILMVGPWGQEVMERSPDVDEIVTCTFPGFARRPKGSWLAPYRLLLQEARRVRRRQVDLALIMRYDHWWGALLAALAGIPQRIGYAIPEVCPFLTQAVPYSVGRHEVHQGLRLVSTLAGGPDEPDGSAGDPQTAPLHFEPTDSEDAWVKRWLLLHDAVPERPLVAIHPGSGSTVKLWLAEKWAAVADTLCERRGVQIVLTGSAGELDLAWAIAARTRIDPLVACGETTLGQLAALYGHCRLVMGPDCGPLHLAVAVGAPTVHLYGPVDVGTFGPWGDPFRHRVLTSRWPCIPCNRLDIVAAECVAHPCVRDIGVARVLAEAESLLSGMW